MNNERLVYGVGRSGDGPFEKYENGKMAILYRKWSGMFTRCYSEKRQIKHPGYIGCSVDSNFHNYQDFCTWAIEQVGHKNVDWELDKDILIKGNKVYGPYACAFVPSEINKLFIANRFRRGNFPVGVHAQNGRYSAMISVNKKSEWLGRFATPEIAFDAYKKRKQELIKHLANKYRGAISEAVYAAMISREVEITD